MTHDEIKKRIMRRVYLIYFTRKALRPAFVCAYVLVGVVVYGVTSVSLVNIFHNTPKVMDMSKLYNFYSYAFMHTEITVKTALIAGIVLVSLVAYGVAQKVIGKTHDTAPRLTFN